MKLIHTSDWHLGHELFTYDRSEEQLSFLEQLREIVREEQPDALVVSGDVYHTSTPSNTTMRLFTNGLDQIRMACPTMQIVVTAGNHDSSSRLEVTRSIWEHLRVSIVGRIQRTTTGVDLDRHLIPIHDVAGQPIGWIVALPHVFPANYPGFEEGIPREERPIHFFQALGKRLGERNEAHLPVVLMAHLALAGSDTTGHDESRGGMDYVEMSLFDAIPYDYLALGHIHCPQYVSGTRARYCGSPLAVSFDETYPHSVTVVEIEAAGMDPRIRLRPIQNPWPLKTWPEEAVEIEEAFQLLESFPADEPCYLRLHVKRKDVVPTYALERAMALTVSKKCRFCRFLWEESQHTKPVSSQSLDLDQFQSLSPIEIADRYYQDTYGGEMDPALRQLLQQTLQDVQQTAND